MLQEGFPLASGCENLVDSSGTLAKGSAMMAEVLQVVQEVNLVVGYPLVAMRRSSTPGLG